MSVQRWRIDGKACAAASRNGPAIVDVGRVDHGLQQVALGVDEHLALPPQDLLPPIVTARSSRFRSFGALAVDNGSGRPGPASTPDALAFAQHAVDALPRAVPAPLAEVVENSRGRRKVVGKVTPLDASPQDIENSINNPAQA